MKLERIWIVNRHFSELLHLQFSKLERRTETRDLVFLKKPQNNRFPRTRKYKCFISVQKNGGTEESEYYTTKAYVKTRKKRIQANNEFANSLQYQSTQVLHGHVCIYTCICIVMNTIYKIYIYFLKCIYASNHLHILTTKCKYFRG